MIVFFKTGTIAFSLDLNLEDPIETSKQKVAERMKASSTEDFTLVYAGKMMNEGTLAGYGVGKEATIHVQQIPPLNITIELDGTSKPVQAPGNKRVTVRDFSRLVKNAFSLPAPPELYKDKELLNESKTLFDSGIRSGDTLEAKKREVVASSTAAVYNDAPLSADDESALFDSFAGASSDVEIAFSFDTTGSMASCIQEVRAKLRESIERLTKDIPSIRIGIIAHGDYCDAANIVKSIDLTSDAEALVKFVANAGSTGGGDAPEAYEYALKKANEFSWTGGCSKALVVIGDEVPHPPGFTDQNIDWFQECDRLAEKGVKIYGVRALNAVHSQPFYEEISERTGGIPINFKNFKSIVDMFLAICYREASATKLKEFEQERQKDGKMEDSEMKAVFEQLSKPNAEKSGKEEVDEEEEAKKSGKDEIDEEKEKNKKKKETPSKKARFVAVNWWDHSIACPMSFKYDESRGYFVNHYAPAPAKVVVPAAKPAVVTPPPVASPKVEEVKTKPRSFTVAAGSKSEKKAAEKKDEKNQIVVCGGRGVGKTCLLRTQIDKKFPAEGSAKVEEGTQITVNSIKLWLHDSNDVKSFKVVDSKKTLYLVCFSVDNSATLDEAIAQAKAIKGAPQMFLVGLKGDLRKGEGEKEVSAKDGLKAAKKMGALKYFEVSSKSENLDQMNALFKEVTLWSTGGMKRDGNCIVM
eukprot:TRINITY_DN153_c0_g1_i1.p1 TRINITY_DN153_c0_g1~~TRINITY_DN153_c0_g1_i1.p1  ORF type:complete len:696 (+),score=336.02 TRINITY_DN153_c0_g1_i1:109-2196(+)